VTRAIDPVEVAHLFPLSLRNEFPFLARNSLWRSLEVFWTRERVISWYDAIFTHGTEAVYNLLCFAPHVHAYHGRGLFGLQPGDLSDDFKCQKVKFYWLTPHRHSKHVDILQTPDMRQTDQKLFNHETEEKIISGQEISLTTSDPNKLPLPDKRILEMQWYLQQVAALKGGAEVVDDDYSDYGDWQEVVLESPKAESTPSSPSLGSTPPSSASRAEVKSIQHSFEDVGQQERERSWVYLGRCSQEVTYCATPTSHSPPDIGDGDILFGNQQVPQQNLEAAYLQRTAREAAIQNIVPSHAESTGMGRGSAHTSHPNPSRGATGKVTADHCYCR
jgi:HNH endonuclease